MANLTRIWVHNPEDKTPDMKVTYTVKGFGEKSLVVEIPKDFMDCIIEIAQTAINLDEQKIRAQLLADTNTEDDK